MTRPGNRPVPAAGADPGTAHTKLAAKPMAEPGGEGASLEKPDFNEDKAGEGTGEDSDETGDSN